MTSLKSHSVENSIREVRTNANVATSPTASIQSHNEDAGWGEGSPPDVNDGREALQAHQRLVFTDPVAFRYLEEDASTTVLERRRRLYGYELYLVEQWACSRVHPTFIITTYTGLVENSVLVSVLSVPTSEDEWSPRLRVYFKSMLQFHARKKATPLGILMVTNLSGFPSALTVIAVPEGDVKKHREDFIVNENLKRMGCFGRTGLTLAQPAAATQEKFHQLYRTSDRVPLYAAVIELTKLCQIALVLFLRLAPEFADGLLCDVTETAINDWWTEVGTDFFNLEPKDGILGPTTVAALLGLLVGARNRLNASGAPVTKDVFDVGNTKRGIAHFQKSQKLPRTRRFDRQTLDRLHKITAKAASGDGWIVPWAVKSTVVELSGKGGDMMLNMVGARDRPGIAEVESTDLETFIQYTKGERCKWLWHGKPRKSSENEMFNNLGGGEDMISNKDDVENYTWSGKRRLSIKDKTPPDQTLADRICLQSAAGSHTSLSPTDKEQILRKTNVLKSVTDKVNDARSGLGRIKDVVNISGLRGHNTRTSKDSIIITHVDDINENQTNVDPSRADSIDIPQVPDGAGPRPVKQSKDIVKRISSREEESKGSDGQPRTVAKRESIEITEPYALTANERCSEPTSKDRKHGNRYTRLDDQSPSEAHSNLAHQYQDQEGTFALMADTGKHAYHADIMDHRSTYSPLLQIARSVPDLRDPGNEPMNAVRNDFRWPRHLSFNAMVDVLAAGEEGQGSDQQGNDATEDLSYVLMSEKSKGYELGNMAERLAVLRIGVAAWVQHKVGDIEGLDIQAGKDQEELDVMYHQKSEEYHTLRSATEDLAAEERGSVAVAVKDIEVLGAKLEYELNALESKVEDVESNIAEFNRQVIELETRALDLHHENEVSETWPRWLTRLCALVYT